MAVKNRVEVEKLIYDTFDAIDPSGTNTNKYKTLFGGMNDKEFENYMKEFLEDDKENFALDIVEYEHSLNMEQCEAAAKVIGVPLMEHVYMPHLTMDKKNVIVTKEKCLVLYLNVKRTQQLLHKKNGLSTSNEIRSRLTGQVIGDDKNARDSDIEAAMLVALGSEAILKELHGPRADDLEMKKQLFQNITAKGYSSLNEIESFKPNKTTLNTVNMALLSMMLKTDIVSELVFTDHILPKVISDVHDKLT